MVRSNTRSDKKESGKKYVDYRKKKKYGLAGIPAHTKIGERVIRHKKVMGGNAKTKTLSSMVVNLADPKTKKIEKISVKTVLENSANRHFVRRNILTKGTVIETEKGKARITSRPGQEGVISAVLI